MKKIKSILGIVLVLTMFISINVSAVPMYKGYNLPPTEVPENEVDFFKSCGWYLESDLTPENKVTMYAPDGRTIDIHKSEVEAYKNVGWYEEPMVTLYAEDGRSQYFPQSEVEAQLTVGWYRDPFVKLYAWGGKSEYFPQSEVEAQLTVGWYREPFVELYSWDGRSQYFPQSEVEAQLTVGWYKDPLVTLYSWDGRSQKFPKSEVKAQKSVGWYEKWELDNLKAEQEEKQRKNIELAKKFYVGQRVCGSVFSYEWYGTVKDIKNGKILVNWDSFYDSYGFRITNQMEIISLEYALGIYINDPTWYDASQVYIAK